MFLLSSEHQCDKQAALQYWLDTITNASKCYQLLISKGVSGEITD